MSRFDRWSRQGMPSSSEADRINKGIADTMRDVINQHAPPIHDRPPLTGEGSAPRPKAEPKEVPIGPPAFMNVIDDMANHFLPQPKPRKRDDDGGPKAA